MKKLILLLLFVLFISIAACSQTITEQIVKYVPITQAQRDGLSPPSNQRWKIFNSTTGVFEYWDGTAWTIFSGGSGTTSLSGLTDVTITTPLTNQVLTYNGTNWINQSIAGTGDMIKSIYDTNDDGVVDNSATLGGQIPNFYLDNTDTQNPLSDNIATTSSTVSASSTAVKIVNDKANANTSAILTKEDDLGNPSTNGYVLSSLTDGTRSWIANGVGGGLSNVVEDATPQLGGDLDLNGHDIPTKEDDLGNPSTNGYVLSSLTDGTRSWIANGVGGSVDQSADYNWTGNHSFNFINRLNTSSPYMYFGNSDGVSNYVGFYPQSDLGAYLGKPNNRWSAIHSDTGNFTGTVSGANAVNNDDFTTKLDLDTAIAGVSGGSVDQSADYNWTGNHSFTEDIVIGDGSNSETRIDFNDANANNSYISVNDGEFSFNAWDGGVYKNIFNASTTRFNLDNSTIASIDAATNKHVVTKEYTDANYATIESSLLNISSLVQDTYIITGTEHNEFLSLNSPTGVDITLDYNNNTPLGTEINFRQSGGGQLTFIEGGNVSIASSETLKTRKQHSVVSLIKVSDAGASAVWSLIGDLELTDSDTTHPTITSITIEDASPSDVVMVFGEPVTGNNLGFTLAGTTSTTFNSFSGSGTTWTGTTATPAANGETITLSYNSTTGDFQDLTGNALADITNQLVTNNVVASAKYGIAFTAGQTEYLQNDTFSSTGATNFEFSFRILTMPSVAQYIVGTNKNTSSNPKQVQCYQNGGNFDLRIRDDAGVSQISASVPFSIGDTYGVKRVGSRMSLMKNGVEAAFFIITGTLSFDSSLIIGYLNTGGAATSFSIDQLVIRGETFLPTTQSSGVTITSPETSDTISVNSAVSTALMYISL